MGLTSLKSPISRSTLADSVYDTLLEAIISGRLPSDTILTSVQLAERLQVSRTPVQEALRRLAADGLVECSAGHRARVIRFTKEDALEIYELRILLEGEAAARAAVHATSQQTAAMRFQIEQLLQEPHDLDWCGRALELDVQFHDQLATAANSTRLQNEIDRYRLLVRSFCRIVGTLQNLIDAAHEHLRIVEAIERQDAEGARQAMREHITARLRVVLQEVFDNPGPDAS